MPGRLTAMRRRFCARPRRGRPAIAVGSVAGRRSSSTPTTRDDFHAAAARRGGARRPPGGGGGRALGRRARQRRRLLPGRGRPQPPRVRGRRPTRCCGAGALSGDRLRPAGAGLANGPLTNAATASRSSNAAPVGARAGRRPRPSTSRSPTRPPSSSATAAARLRPRRRPRPRRPTCGAPATRGRPAATPVMPLLIGGTGINVYRPVYRDGAPIATVAERRAALLGFAAGGFRVNDLAAAAISRAARRRRRPAAVERRRSWSGPSGDARRRRHGADHDRRPHLAAGRPRPQPARTSACRC